METISVEQVIASYKQACEAVEIKGRFVRNGNWQPTAQALRHADCKEASVTVVAQDGATILKIEPKAVEPPPGKSAFKRPAFHLIVI